MLIGGFLGQKGDPRRPDGALVYQVRVEAGARHRMPQMSWPVSCLCQRHRIRPRQDLGELRDLKQGATPPPCKKKGMRTNAPLWP